ncbi:MAG: hypothetical protein AAFQ09_05525 [Pseudomonadota bacterium]
MREFFFGLLFLLVLAPQTTAEVSARPLVVMLDNTENIPQSSGTLVGDGTALRVVFPSRIALEAGLCARFRDDGGCFSLSDPRELPGLSLTTAVINASVDDILSEVTLEKLSTTAPAPWTIVDRDSLAEAEISWIGRDDFTNWRQPFEAARITGASDTGFTLAHPDLGPLDEGAVVEDPQTGLIGIVARAQNGRAGIVNSETVFDALLTAGLDIPAEMRPTTRLSDLPPAIEAEIGGFWIFSHYPGQDIGLSGFYGPGSGLGYSGWGADFDTNVLYQVFSLEEHMQNGTAQLTLLTESETRQTYGGSGWSLGAPYPGATPAFAASCVIHAVPSAPDRRIFQMTFWRLSTDQVFQQVAFAQKGWAADDNACQDAFAALGDAREIIESAAPRSAAPAVAVAPLPDDFTITWDPVSTRPSAVAQIDDLTIGVTCGPANQPVVFYRSGSGAAPHIMVDVYRANLDDWTAWQSGDVTTYHAPLHPDAARGWAFGAGTSVTFNDQNKILLGGDGVSAAETALSDCLE